MDDECRITNKNKTCSVAVCVATEIINGGTDLWSVLHRLEACAPNLKLNPVVADFSLRYVDLNSQEEAVKVSVSPPLFKRGT